MSLQIDFSFLFDHEICSFSWFDNKHEQSVLQHKFEENYFYPYVKHRSFLLSDFLGSIGGLMGLLAGISVISLIEIFYYFFSETFSSRPKRRVDLINIKASQERRQAFEEKHICYQLSKYVMEFTGASSVHGFPFTTERAHNRLFWFVVVLFCLGACSYLIIDAKKHAELKPVLFGIDENIWNIKDVRENLINFITCSIKVRAFLASIPYFNILS